MAQTSDVGGFYDGMGDVMASAGEGNIHFGYWHSPDDQADFATAAEQMTAQVTARLQPTPGQHILDVGCGVGVPAVALASAHNVRVTGISISQRQVDQATTRATAAGMADQVTFQYADAAQLPFADNTFDGAWAMESLLHMPDRGAALREASRVLRPGGRLAISDFLLRAPLDSDTKRDLVSSFCGVAQISSIISIDLYRALIEAAGLRVLDVTDVSDHVRTSLLDLAQPLYARPDLVETFYGADAKPWLMDLTQRFVDLPETGYVLIAAQKPRGGEDEAENVTPTT